MIYNLNSTTIVFEMNDSELEGLLSQSSFYLLNIIWRLCNETIKTSSEYLSVNFIDKKHESSKEKEEIEKAKDFCFERISKSEQIIYKIEGQLEDRNFYKRFKIL